LNVEWFVPVFVMYGLETMALYRFLKSKGVFVTFFGTGTPGYLDFLYIRWCKENSINYWPRILLRLVILAGIAFAAYFVAFRAHEL